MRPDEFKIVQQTPNYVNLRNAVSQRKLPLAIICGAGLSAPANLPTWPMLRKTLAKKAEITVSSLNQLGEKYYNSKLKTLSTTDDLWLAFQLLEEILGGPAFRNGVAEALTPDPNASLPAGYHELMRLKPKGLVTLNLDKFAGEAMEKAYPGNRISPIYGLELAKRWNSIVQAPQYLVHLHGELSDPSNWILTMSQLRSLLSSKAHEYFLYKLYSEYIVVFAGLGLQDIALSSRLLELKKEGFIPPALYWLTNRLDESVQRWARENDVSTINYRAHSHDDHVEFLHQLADDLTTFMPVDDPHPRPVSSGPIFITENGPEDPKLLAHLEPESVRKILSNRLNKLLSSSKEDDVYQNFQDFCRKNRFPLNTAFYKDDNEEFSTWFEYKIDFPSLGRGNFGEVFRAVKFGKEDPVALKILHDNILVDMNMLGGFRRGIRSMRILSDAQIPGIAKLIESFELPPTIIMEHIDGVTLQDGLESRPKLPWTIKLKILHKVAAIVHTGHSLPMTVMHRDLKPSNIMIRNFDYTSWFEPDVVVLDFDMSWHKGSKEKDVVFESRDDFGYLAPEQTSHVRGVSAVSTRVDSYGLGMTAFYLFGGVHPRPNEGLSEQWLEMALRATKVGYAEQWRSAPRRLSRLIRECTRINQTERLDFSLALKELDDLLSAVLSPEDLENPAFWAEEVLANLPSAPEYIWNDTRNFGEIRMERGILVKGTPNYRDSSVEMYFSYVDKGIENHARVSQRLNSVPTSMRKTTENSPWNIDSQNRSGDELAIQVSISTEYLRSDKKGSLAQASKLFKIFEGIVGG